MESFFFLFDGGMLGRGQGVILLTMGRKPNKDMIPENIL
jgi:hypothetical protein